MYLKYTRSAVTLLSAMLFMIFISCDTKKGASEEDATSDSTESIEENTTTKDEKTAPIASPRKQTKGTVNGGVAVTVDYGSPAVKDRKIWGGLEAYGEVWRAGANETTAVEFGSDVMVGGEKVAAGKYGLYMIPNENSAWVVILNTDWDREKHGAWGAYNYNEEHDLVRVEVSPEMVEENQERLEYTVVEEGIAFAWEKARLTIPVSKAGAE